MEYFNYRTISLEQIIHNNTCGAPCAVSQPTNSICIQLYLCIWTRRAARPHQSPPVPEINRNNALGTKVSAALVTMANALTDGIDLMQLFMIYANNNPFICVAFNNLI